jgi:hypothetical protein
LRVFACRIPGKWEEWKAWERYTSHASHSSYFGTPGCCNKKIAKPAKSDELGRIPPARRDFPPWVRAFHARSASGSEKGFFPEGVLKPLIGANEWPKKMVRDTGLEPRTQQAPLALSRDDRWLF